MTRDQAVEYLHQFPSVCLPTPLHVNVEIGSSFVVLLPPVPRDVWKIIVGLWEELATEAAAAAARAAKENKA